MSESPIADPFGVYETSRQSPKRRKTMFDLPTVVADVNASIQRAAEYLYVTRCSDLQKQAIGDLSKIKDTLVEVKASTVANQDENTSNLLLGYESCLDAVIHELKMWILLKQQDPDVAWGELVAAQTSAMHAVSAHAGLHHLTERHKRLLEIERLVFPPQVFLSPGLIVERKECSICGADYEECDHLVGKPYMGQFCFTIIRKASIDHIARVDSPASKHARVTAWPVEGGTRNWMTGRVQKGTRARVFSLLCGAWRRCRSLLRGETALGRASWR